MAGGFTLLELMTVMVIISILAAIGVGSMRFAQNNAAASKSKTLLKTVELALEKYQLTYGEYPAADGAESGAALLYKVITGDLNGNGDIDGAEKPLLEGIFSGNDDKFNNVDEDSGNFVLIDGWGNPLQYHRADEAGYTARNGTYDLWSYGTEEDGVVGGEEKWIKNW